MRKELDNILEQYGVKIDAKTILTALAANGTLIINNSKLYANEKIIWGSSEKGTAIIGNESTMATSKSKINMPKGAYIKSRNSQIEMNEDGSINYKV